MPMMFSTWDQQTVTKSLASPTSPSVLHTEFPLYCTLVLTHELIIRTRVSIQMARCLIKIEMRILSCSA